MASSGSDQALNESSGRRVRTLYGDPDSARRNIMRLPNADAPVDMQDQMPIMGTNATVMGDVESRDGLRQAENLRHIEEAASANERASSIYPNSAWSDPFDLNVSDDGGDQRVNNIDAVVATADYDPAGFEEVEAYEYGGPFAEYDEGAYAQSYVPSYSRSPFHLMSALTRCFVQEHGKQPRRRQHRRTYR